MTSLRVPFRTKDQFQLQKIDFGRVTSQYLILRFLSRIIDTPKTSMDFKEFLICMSGRQGGKLFPREFGEQTASWVWYLSSLKNNNLPIYFNVCDFNLKTFQFIHKDSAIVNHSTAPVPWGIIFMLHCSRQNAIIHSGLCCFCDFVSFHFFFWYYFHVVFSPCFTSLYPLIGFTVWQTEIIIQRIKCKQKAWKMNAIVT